MPYVEPNSTADFFYNTGLSMSHENTLYFADVPTKDQYFADYNHISVNHVTYQREHRGFIRVDLPMNRMYNVDYMRFRNISFENHYFYAFVTAVNYINNNTTEVQYVLDPLMTWMGAFALKQCFVERQHVTNDNIGANIADEGLGLGEFVCEGTESSKSWGTTNSTIRLQYANPDEAKANTWGGIYNPTTFVDSDASGIASRINSLVDQDLADNIVNIYMVPTDFANPGGVHTQEVSVSKPYGSVAGYVPKNKKLFCYPYKYLLVDNSEGDTKKYRYEYFNSLPDATSTGSCKFSIIGTSVNNVEVSMCPEDYNGQGGVDWTDRIGMSHFPQCAWTTDNYKAYLAQKNAYFSHDVINSNPTMRGIAIGQNLGEQAGQTLGGNQYYQGEWLRDTYGRSGGVAGGVAGGVLNTIASSGTLMKDTLATKEQIEKTLVDNLVPAEGGTRVSGSATTDLMFTNNTKKFTFKHMSISKNYAIMIDNYFSMYGYKVGQILTPNMNARPHWTYVKTDGCDVAGNLPASDKRSIENIFDSGVRFWHNLSELGNYSLNNSPA